MDRYELAWRIWCYTQGYVLEEDREILTNWFRQDDSILHEKDQLAKQVLLKIADELIESVRGPQTLVFHCGGRTLRVGDGDGFNGRLLGPHRWMWSIEPEPHATSGQGSEGAGERPNT